MDTTIEMYLTISVFLYISAIAIYRESVEVLHAFGWSKPGKSPASKPSKVSPLHRPKVGRVIVKSYARQV